MLKEELLDLIERALVLKSQDIQRRRINSKILNEVGSFDSARRYEVNLEYRTDSCRFIRTPSRAWPFSELKHVCSNKYLKQLREKLQGE